jgi:hypothetical protein
MWEVASVTLRSNNDSVDARPTRVRGDLVDLTEVQRLALLPVEDRLALREQWCERLEELVRALAHFHAAIAATIDKRLQEAAETRHSA